MLPSTAPGAGAPTRSERPRATIWLAYAVMGALLVGYVALKVVRGNGYWPLVDGWMVAAFELVLSGMCITRGVVRRPGRPVALALGFGLLSWSLGDVVLTVESLGGATPSTPSLADAFYLGFFPLAYVAVVLFMRGDTRHFSTPSWLDGAVAGLGAAALCAAFAFPSLRRLAGGDSLAVATNLAYPVGDLLLLFLVVGGTAVLSGRSKAPWLLLATGVSINVAGDTFNLFGSSIGATHLGTVVNAVAWPISILLMSLAVWVRPGISSPFAHQKPPAFVLPGLAAFSALAILVFGTLHQVGGVAIGLAAATLLLVAARVALSARTVRALTEKRYEQSMTDDLTGLGNRRYLFQILDAFFNDHAAAGQTPGRTLAFLFIDLNRFKEFNDSFGHPAGDEVLRQLGARLQGSLRGSDRLIRLGGDEFAAVLLGADVEYATTIAQQLTDSLAEPFLLDPVRPCISASIGISLAPKDATDSGALLWCADAAMYRAKSGSVPFALFERQKDFDGGGNSLRLAEELREAIAESQLVLHYQPQLDLRTNEIPSVEALVRWTHPRLGLVAPLNFLSVAEEAGLMRSLTRFVLERALRQCATWRAAGHRQSVSVNVSATNLLDAGFIDLIAELLARHELPPPALVLEITETSIIREFERSRLVIERMRDLGIVVSIDDFGSGFTSLAYLSSLAVAELKLDRTFITRLANGEKKREVQLIRATIELGHALGLRVVAEGVEDEATLALLSDLGCDLAQGYLIDVPRPPSELAFLARAGSSTAPSGPPRRHDQGRGFSRRPSGPALAGRRDS